MNRRFENVEMYSTIEYNVGQRDASDPEVEFRAHMRERDAGQLLAGIADSVAVGPQTDANARQPADPGVGHWPAGFSPQGDPTATLPSTATEASAAWRGQTHSTPYPTATEVAYYGPRPSVSGAIGAVQSSAMGSGLGYFVGPSSAQLEGERATAPNWGEFTPTTTGARTNTTTTLTSTYVTCSTVDGPIHAAYLKRPIPAGPTSVHPVGQAFMPPSIEPSGRFPGVLAGPAGILRPMVGTVESNWGDASAASGLSSMCHKLPIGQ